MKTLYIDPLPTQVDGKKPEGWYIELMPRIIYAGSGNYMKDRPERLGPFDEIPGVIGHWTDPDSGSENTLFRAPTWDNCTSYHVILDRKKGELWYKSNMSKAPINIQEYDLINGQWVVKKKRFFGLF